MLLPTVLALLRRPPRGLSRWVFACVVLVGSGCFPARNVTRTAESSILEQWARLDANPPAPANAPPTPTALTGVPNSQPGVARTGNQRPTQNGQTNELSVEVSTADQVSPQPAVRPEPVRWSKKSSRSPAVAQAAYETPASPTRAATTAAQRRPKPIQYPAELDRHVVGVNYEEEEQPPARIPARPKAKLAQVGPPGNVPQAGKPLAPQLRAPPRPDLPPLPDLPLEELPPDDFIQIPFEGDQPGDAINLTMKNGRITLIARNAPVQSILNLMAQQQGLNLIAADDVQGNISVTLTDAGFEDVLSSIVAIAGCTWTQQKGIILVTKVSADARTAPGLQGKVVQVFPLNFVSAADIEATIRGLVSPTGQIFITEISPTDKRRTQEQVVVEDIPSSLQRIAEYITQVDQPPRQVMIETHVLQVDLRDDTRHGINWSYLTKIANQNLTLSTVGFANPSASPASILSLDGAHLDVLVEALKTTTDTKTLANPKVIVANGQEARIQIGSKLGYFVTTTTQTSTLQNVNFLNTGVLLKVTPQISNDNRLLLFVQPEISTGKISPAGLPETETTEASTTVLMEDGGGMVIGGMIKESDNEIQDKIPILGDMWLVGRLFQRRSVNRQRSEIIIVLIPRIAPYTPEGQAAEQVDVAKTVLPIFTGALQKAPRPWEAQLPDAIENPRRLRLDRLPTLIDDPLVNNPKPLQYYFPTRDEAYRETGFPPPVIPAPRPAKPAPVLPSPGMPVIAPF